MLRSRRDAPTALRLAERYGPVDVDAALRGALLAERPGGASLWADLVHSNPGAGDDAAAAAKLVLLLARRDDALRVAALLELLAPKWPEALQAPRGVRGEFSIGG